MNPAPAASPRLLLAVAVPLLLAAALWLRWPGFGHGIWNVDEAIHAAAARTILDGGVLYRDAVDQRTPLTYYAVAGVFALAGENNLSAVHVLVALLVGGTAWLLLVAGRALHGLAAGAVAAALYVLLSVGALYPGDAHAANTEWFAAFFSCAAAALFLAAGRDLGPARCFGAGLLLGCAFLSKQPALLDAAAPLAALLYAAATGASPWRRTGLRLLAGVAGWLLPVLLAAAWFALHGALRDAVFYTWGYNLAFYGPEISTADRLVTLAQPFRLVGAAHPWLVALWAVAALAAFRQLVQRTPTADETRSNPGLVFVTAWSLATLAGAAAGGRGFDHYAIPFLPVFCLGAGWCLAGLAAARRARRVVALAALAVVLYEAGATALRARHATLPADPSVRVSAHIRAHSRPEDRIFVWGFHPDIYLLSDRRPASRFLYGSFLSGLIPWTNTAPERDTAYAIVPGARAQLLADLAARPPAFIVDCSAGPNRHWQKYPLATFPGLEELVRKNYVADDPGQFVPQGFRLFRLRRAGDPAPEAPAAPLPAELAAGLVLPTLGPVLAPVRATAPLGASRDLVDGRQEYFAHAPSLITYRLPAGRYTLRGGFGLRPAAYAPDNRAPTDGAEFIIRWRPDAGPAAVLLHRLLRPREDAADRSEQTFLAAVPAAAGGELDFEITPGPTGIPASDWTYWSDLLLENYR